MNKPPPCIGCKGKKKKKASNPIFKSFREIKSQKERDAK